MLAVRPITLVKVFSPHPNKAIEFSRWTQLTFGIECLAVAEPCQALTGSTIVVTATTATEPVFSGDWLEAGTHISAIGANTPKKREIDMRTLERSITVADSKDQVLDEAGDIRDAISAGVISADAIIELGDVVLGRNVRSESKEITLFKSVGTAIQDLACAAYIYEQAIARGIGTPLTLTDGEDINPA